MFEEPPTTAELIMDSPQAAADPFHDSQGCVIVDAACLHCGYNLRGLAGGGACPECGNAVASSLRGGLLRFASPAWLRRVSNGVLLLIIAIVATIFDYGVCVAFMISIGARGGGPPAAMQTMMHTPVMLFGLSILVLTLIGFAGVFLVSTPDSAAQRETEGWTARRLLRVTLYVSLGTTALHWLSYVLTSAFASVPTAPFGSLPSGLAGQILFGATMVLSLICMSFILPLALIRHLASLMRHVPRPGLVKLARVVFWGHLCSTIVVGAGYAIMTPAMFRTARAASAAMTASAPSGAAAWIPGPGGTYSSRTSTGLMWMAWPTGGPGGVVTTVRNAPLQNIGYLGGPTVTTTAGRAVPAASGPAFTPIWVSGPGGQTYKAPSGTIYTVTAAPVMPSGGFMFGGCIIAPAACAECGFAIAGFVFLILAQRALSAAATEAAMNAAAAPSTV